MKPELTPEDRKRIEQEAKEYYGINWNGLRSDYFFGYEAATIYEREQQAELRNKVESALRSVVRHGLLEIDGYETVLKEVHEALNSLKTK